MKFEKLAESILGEAKTKQTLPYTVSEYGDVVWFKNTSSLAGAPRGVKGSFSCVQASLERLEGGPVEVEGNYACYGNHLTDLEGAPEKIGGIFICWGNPLKSLKGIPEARGYGLPPPFADGDALKEVARRKLEKSLDKDTVETFGDFISEL